MENTTAEPVHVDAYLEGAALGTHLLRPGEWMPVKDVEFGLNLKLESVDFDTEAIEVSVGNGDVKGGPFMIERDEDFEIRVNDAAVTIEIADSFDF